MLGWKSVDKQRENLLCSSWLCAVHLRECAVLCVYVLVLCGLLVFFGLSRCGILSWNVCGQYVWNMFVSCNLDH